MDATSMVLSALADSPRDAREIQGEVGRVSGARMRVGALYAALDRLQGAGLVEPGARQVVDGRQRRYYRLLEPEASGRGEGAQWLRTPTIAVLVAAACVLAVVWSAAAAAWQVPLHRTDLLVYVSSVRAVKDGIPLYDFVAPSGYPFTYPPFALLSFWPLDPVPENALRVAWVIALYGAGAVCVVAPARRLGLGWAPAFTGAALLFISAPMHSNVKYVQVSLVMVLMALLDGLGLVPRWLRGVPTGVAGAIKLTPLIFIPYFLVTGQRAAAARSAMTFLGCTAAAGVILPSDSWTFWTSAVFAPGRTGPVQFHVGIGDQSIWATLLRLGLPYDSSGARILGAALGVAVCVAVLIAARSLHRAGKVTEAVVAVGCASLLASPVSWTHHLVWTVLAGLLLLSYPVWRARLAGALILAVMTLHPKTVAALLQHAPGTGILAPSDRALCALGCCLAACAWAHRLRYNNDRYITLP